MNSNINKPPSYNHYIMLKVVIINQYCNNIGFYFRKFLILFNSLNFKKYFNIIRYYKKWNHLQHFLKDNAGNFLCCIFIFTIRESAEYKCIPSQTRAAIEYILPIVVTRFHTRPRLAYECNACCNCIRLRRKRGNPSRAD